ncbi:MAG: Dabb family protein [Pirellulales bacterium]|nr:Dabb family protein [Pirellulales bacterium]
MLAHDVYFTLKDNSDESKEKLLEGCKKYLADHPGVIWFDAGILAEELQRDVNDQGFDIALHLVFKDKASHDRYMTAEKHLKFMREFSESWKSVRVFDSYLKVSFHAEMQEQESPAHEEEKARDPEHGHHAAEHADRKLPRLPDMASGFAGMIRGKVEKKLDSGMITLTVLHIDEEWEHSKADKPKSLLGKTVLIEGRRENGEPVAKFLRSLQVGEIVTIDVAHKGQGEALTILELTEEQRERIK